ncbi:hypothetical protein AMTRI_Chr06g177470 [Amborella trichopoda]|uniref:Uncharacterized protein n=1 Tax=Amborella trichopoda TaxID=13333 RepID=W1PZN8_AMBTC|nr:hypothetical protein AMTR_s00049p00098090 [Amborella trichopoda]
MASTEGNRSFGLSWADQWDSGPSEPTPIYKEMEKPASDARERPGKTKEGASASFKKVMTGTLSGIRWMKEKCNKKTHK